MGDHKLCINALHFLNKMVDLIMLRIVGHDSRGRYLHSTFGDSAFDVPTTQTYALRPPVSVSIPGSACASVYCYFVLFLLLLYDTVCEVYK